MDTSLFSKKSGVAVVDALYEKATFAIRVNLNRVKLRPQHTMRRVTAFVKSNLGGDRVRGLRPKIQEICRMKIAASVALLSAVCRPTAVEIKTPTLHRRAASVLCWVFLDNGAEIHPQRQNSFSSAFVSNLPAW